MAVSIEFRHGGDWYVANRYWYGIMRAIADELDNLYGESLFSLWIRDRGKTNCGDFDFYHIGIEQQKQFLHAAKKCLDDYLTNYETMADLTRQLVEMIEEEMSVSTNQLEANPPDSTMTDEDYFEGISHCLESAQKAQELFYTDED